MWWHVHITCGFVVDLNEELNGTILFSISAGWNIRERHHMRFWGQFSDTNMKVTNIKIMAGFS